MRIFKIYAVSIIIFVSMPITSYAYDNKTVHRKINEHAVNQTNLDHILKYRLGLFEGIATVFNRLEIWEWIREGGFMEDEPEERCTRHFHDPLKPWDTAGLFYTHLTVFESSLLWAMDIDQKSVNIYAWNDARDYLFMALTATAREQREIKFAQCFRTIGQVMHLISDKSVPAHVRNDPHIPIWPFSDPDPYELWTAKQALSDSDPLVYTGPNSIYYTSIFNRAANLTDYPVPISALWDQDRYDGTNPEETWSDQHVGLAEFTNANFFSSDTIFSDYDHPWFPDTNISSVDFKHPEVIVAEDGGIDNKLYVKRMVNGNEKYNLYSISWYSYNCLAEGHFEVSPPVLDDVVHRDYASELIPRAVGYSANLLDYFFRGELEITAPDEFVYALIDGSVIEDDKDQQVIKQIKAKVKNISVREKDDQGAIISYEQMGQGQLLAVARYRIRPNYIVDLSDEPPKEEVMENVEYSYSVSAPEDIPSLGTSDPATNEPEEYNFNFSANPIPVGITDLYLQVIFKGTLGNEEDIAVAVGMKDLNEPLHIVFWNNTDYFLLDGEPRKEEDIINDPNVQAYGYISPYNLTLNLGFAGTETDVFAAPIVATIQDLPSGRYSRFIMLLEEPEADEPDEFWVKDHTSSFIDDSEWFYTLPRAINQENEDGTYTLTPVYDVRGIIQHQISYFIRYYPYFVYNPFAFPAPPENSLGPYPVTINLP